MNNFNPLRSLIVLAVFMLGLAGAKAENKFVTRLDAGFVVGMQIVNDNILYNPGKSINLSYNYVLTEDLQVGLGTGFMQMKEEDFIPIYLEFVGYKSKKKRAPLIKMAAGYSFVQGDRARNLQNYSVDGGAYFSAGLGYKWNINSSYSFVMQSAYTHQFTSLDYTIYGTRKYSQHIDYAMFVLSFGIMMH